MSDHDEDKSAQHEKPLEFFTSIANAGDTSTHERGLARAACIHTGSVPA